MPILKCVKDMEGKENIFRQNHYIMERWREYLQNLLEENRDPTKINEEQNERNTLEEDDFIHKLKEVL